MKMKLVLAGLLIVLLNTGSSCVNDGFLVPVNLPISKTWAINSGGSTSLNKDTTIVISSQLDPSYLGKVQKVRLYDIRVSVSGDFPSNPTVAGAASVNGTQVITFSGNWNDFKTPQSLLDPNSHAHVAANTNVYLTLENALNAFISNSQSTVRLTSTGSVGATSVPSGLFLTIEILAQADAQVGGGDTSQ